MRTPAQIAGHPIHPMLVTVPIGLWIFSLACDLVALTTGNSEPWSTVALYAMVGGCIGAALAAIPGLIDFLSLRDAGTRRVALTHMVLNVTVLTLFAVNAFLRGQATIDAGTSLGLSALSVVLLAVSGWLGGKMVYLKGVAVHIEGGEATTSAADAWTSGRGATTASQPRTGARAMNPDRAMASDRQRDTDRSGRS